MALNKNFVSKVIKRLEERYENSWNFEVTEVLNNNGIVLCGLTAKRNEMDRGLTVYLDSYYKLYESGMSLEEITEDIGKLLESDQGVPIPEYNVLSDFEKIKERVCYKLINKKKNEEMLRQMPYVPFEDLAIVFYLFLNQNEHGQMITSIFNEHMDKWKTSAKELYKLAEKNTGKLLSRSLCRIEDVIKDMTKENLGELFDDSLMEVLLESRAPGLYVLSNKNGINGAVVMLYPGIMRTAAKDIGSDLLILPSSIHEVLLTPYDDSVDLDVISEIVNIINEQEVVVEDILSDSLYYYDYKKDSIGTLKE